MKGNGLRRAVWMILMAAVSVVTSVVIADERKIPASVKELWVDFDPRKEPLDAKIVREWETDSVVYRSVHFHIGTFHGRPARMAAFYGFPKGTTQAPALLHLHGDRVAGVVA